VDLDKPLAGAEKSILVSNYKRLHQNSGHRGFNVILPLLSRRYFYSLKNEFKSRFSLSLSPSNSFANALYRRRQSQSVTAITRALNKWSSPLTPASAGVIMTIAVKNLGVAGQ